MLSGLVALYIGLVYVFLLCFRTLLTAVMVYCSCGATQCIASYFLVFTCRICSEHSRFGGLIGPSTLPCLVITSSCSGQFLVMYSISLPFEFNDSVGGREGTILQPFYWDLVLCFVGIFVRKCLRSDKISEGSLLAAMLPNFEKGQRVRLTKRLLNESFSPVFLAMRSSDSLEPQRSSGYLT